MSFADVLKQIKQNPVEPMAEEVPDSGEPVAEEGQPTQEPETVKQSDTPEKSEKPEPEGEPEPEKTFEQLLEEHGLKTNHIVKDLPSFVKSYSAKEGFIQKQMKDIQNYQEEIKKLRKELESKPKVPVQDIDELPELPDPLSDDYDEKRKQYNASLLKYMDLIKEKAKEEKVNTDAQYEEAARQENMDNWTTFSIKHFDDLPEHDEQLYIHQMKIKLDTLIKDPERFRKDAEKYFDKNFLQIGQLVVTKDGLNRIWEDVKKDFAPARTVKTVAKVPVQRGTEPAKPETVAKENQSIPSHNGQRPGSFAAKIMGLKKG